MRTVSLALCAALAACAPPAREPQAPTPEVAVSQEQALKRAEAAAPGFDVAIDQAAARAARVDLGLPAALQRAIDGAPAPVLLPALDRLAHTAQLTQGPGWWAAQMRGDGVNVYVHAFARGQRRPELGEKLRAAGYGDGTPRYSAVDEIRSVSFERYGVAYLLEVECARAAADPRCAGDDYPEAVYASLATVGGAP